MLREWAIALGFAAAAALSFVAYARLGRAVHAGTPPAIRRNLFLALGVLGLLLSASSLLLIQLGPEATARAFPRPVDRPTFDSLLARQIADSERAAAAQESTAATLRRQASNDSMFEGISLARTGRIFDAIKKYDVALAIDPRNSRAYGLKGFALFRRGRTDEAIQVMRKGIEIDQSDPWAYYNLALALWKAGDRQEALRTVDQALQRDCYFREVILSDVQYRDFLNQDPALRALIDNRCPAQ